MRSLGIPYETTMHGPEFRIFSHAVFRLDTEQNQHLLRYDHGDKTLDLLDELESSIAGNDYAFVRNYIKRKRDEYLLHLDWKSQQHLSTTYDTA